MLPERISAAHSNGELRQSAKRWVSARCSHIVYGLFSLDHHHTRLGHSYHNLLTWQQRISMFGKSFQLASKEQENIATNRCSIEVLGVCWLVRKAGRTTFSLWSFSWKGCVCSLSTLRSFSGGACELLQYSACTHTQFVRVSRSAKICPVAGFSSASLLHLLLLTRDMPLACIYRTHKLHAEWAVPQVVAEIIHVKTA